MLVINRCPECCRYGDNELIRIVINGDNTVDVRVMCSSCEWLWWETQDLTIPR